MCVSKRILFHFQSVFGSLRMQPASVCNASLHCGPVEGGLHAKTVILLPELLSSKNWKYWLGGDVYYGENCPCPWRRHHKSCSYAASYTKLLSNVRNRPTSSQTKLRMCTDLAWRSIHRMSVCRMIREVDGI